MRCSECSLQQVSVAWQGYGAFLERLWYLYQLIAQFQQQLTENLKQLQDSSQVCNISDLKLSTLAQTNTRPTLQVHGAGTGHTVHPVSHCSAWQCNVAAGQTSSRHSQRAQHCGLH